MRRQIESIIANAEEFTIDDSVDEIFDLFGVSYQRKLLIDYMKWFDDNRDMYYEVSNKEMIDKYIKSINCG